MRNRLIEHMTLNKDRSIFRKNLGRALLNKSQDTFLRFWEMDLTKKADRARYGPLVDKGKQRQVEEAVSQYITSNLSYSVIGVTTDALALEQRCIGTVSRCSICAPSLQWLGRHSPKLQIQESGLWQVQHLYCNPISAGHLKLLEAE